MLLKPLPGVRHPCTPLPNPSLRVGEGGGCAYPSPSLRVGEGGGWVGERINKCKKIRIGHRQALLSHQGSSLKQQPSGVRQPQAAHLCCIKVRGRGTRLINDRSLCVFDGRYAWDTGDRREAEICYLCIASI